MGVLIKQLPDDRMKHTEWHFLLRGFTIIELMITLAVIGIGATIALPYLRDFVIGQRVKTAATTLYTTMIYARSEAIKRNGSVTIDSGGDWESGWKVCVDTDSDTLCESGESVLKNENAVQGVTLSSVEAVTSLMFTREGRISPTGMVRFNSTASGDANIIPRCVIVEASGRASTRTGACP